jgi:hypothetical protein
VVVEVDYKLHLLVNLVVLVVLVEEVKVQI